MICDSRGAPMWCLQYLQRGDKCPDSLYPSVGEVLGRCQGEGRQSAVFAAATTNERTLNELLRSIYVIISDKELDAIPLESM